MYDLLHTELVHQRFFSNVQMPYYLFFWTSDREEKLEQHGVLIEDFEEIVQNPARTEKSHSSDRWIAFGYDSEGEWTACVYELDDDGVTVFPITAYHPGA